MCKLKSVEKKVLANLHIYECLMLKQSILYKSFWCHLEKAGGSPFLGLGWFMVRTDVEKAL